MLERTLVKSLGWPEGRRLVLAHEAGTRLAERGLRREAILVWLDQVYAEPVKFVNDPALSRLALALLCPHHEKDVNRANYPEEMHVLGLQVREKQYFHGYWSVLGQKRL